MSRALMQVFDFHESVVRTILRDGEVWFVAKDVAEILGYKEPGVAIRTHCKGGVKHTLPSGGSDKEYTIIPERDVYRLIFRSKLPAAERFEEWVVSEVLPAIRKTGQYGPLKRCTEVEAAEIFPMFHRVAKLVGLDRNRAAIAANAATKRLTDVDLLELLEVADSVGGEVTPDNNTLLRGLIQLMDTEPGPVKGTFKDVLERVAALVKPDRRDYTFPNPHKFRRSLERIKSQLADAGISFEFGKHTARGHVIEVVNSERRGNSE